MKRFLLLACCFLTTSALRLSDELQEQALAHQEPGAGALNEDLQRQLDKFVADGLFNPENLTKLIETVPDEVKPRLEQFQPLLEQPATAQAVVETIVAEMTPEQQDKISKTITAIDNGEPDASTEKLAEVLAEEVKVTMDEKAADPEFIGKLVSKVAKAAPPGEANQGLVNGALASVFKALLPDSMDFIAEPLVKFMNVGGEDLRPNLARLKSGDLNSKFPMDGPLRTLTVLANALAFSPTFQATTINANSSASDDVGFDVKTSKGALWPDLKWWISKNATQGMDAILRALDAKMTKLELIREEIQDGVLLMVNLHIETVEDTPHRILIRSVRAGLSETYTGDINFSDLYFVLALHEDAIRSAIGKFTSLADWAVRLSRTGVAKWALQKLGLPADGILSHIVESHRRRDEVQDGIKSFIEGWVKSTPPATTDTAEVFTGLSMGGSIAQLLAMKEKLDCADCPVFSLTFNSGGVAKLAKTMELTPRDTRPWWRRVFPHRPLVGMSTRFGGIINFAMQHDVIWKLDRRIPGSNMCIFMHSAESVGCRGIEDVRDVYTGLLDAFKECRKPYWKESNDEYSEQGCMTRRSSPILGCVMKEHFNLPSEDIDTTKSLPSAGFNSSMSEILVKDFVDIFDDQNVQPLPIEDTEHLAGYTYEARQLKESDQEVRDVERAAKYAEIDAWRDQEIEAAITRIGGLPVCNGSPDPWAEEKDLRKYRCCSKKCAASDDRTPCGSGEERPEDETCWGFWRHIRSARLTCQCRSGLCWDGTKCSADGFHQQRLGNQTQEKTNAQKRIWARQVFEDIAKHKKELYEASLVKRKEKKWVVFHKLVDAETRSAYERKWACSF